MIETDAFYLLRIIMEVLKFSETLFKCLGINPIDKIKKPFDHFVKTLIFCLFLISFTMGIGCSGTYIYRNFGDFSHQPAILVTSLITTGFLHNMGSFIDIAMSKDKMNILRSELQKTIDNGKKRDWRNAKVAITRKTSRSQTKLISHFFLWKVFFTENLFIHKKGTI